MESFSVNEDNENEDENTIKNYIYNMKLYLNNKEDKDA